MIQKVSASGRARTQDRWVSRPALNSLGLLVPVGANFFLLRIDPMLIGFYFLGNQTKRHKS